MWPALIVQYGLPLAAEIWRTFQQDTITEEDWQRLIKLGEKRAKDYLAEAEARLQPVSPK